MAYEVVRARNRELEVVMHNICSIRRLHLILYVVFHRNCNWLSLIQWAKCCVAQRMIVSQHVQGCANYHTCRG